ncbi:hypothetical protein TNCV_1403251 [Trichonephila clavipes]|nr:hypothetical protein TNCV_1403251 [Trichonephila clavipes]
MKQWTSCGHSTLLQTVSNGTSGHQMRRNRLNLVHPMVRDMAAQSITAMSTIHCHHGQWCNEVDAIGPVDPSFPLASSDDRSASMLLGFVQHVDRFL